MKYVYSELPTNYNVFGDSAKMYHLGTNMQL